MFLNAFSELNKNTDSKLSFSTKHKDIVIQDDGTIKYIGSSKDRKSVRTLSPMTHSTRFFYFEVDILSESRKGIVIGLAPFEIKHDSATGWDNKSIGYSGNNGVIYHSAKQKVATTEKFTKGDIVGCEMRRVDYDGSAYTISRFTKNGRRVGPLRCLDATELYPTISIGRNGMAVRANTTGSNFTYTVKGIIL